MKKSLSWIVAAILLNAVSIGFAYKWGFRKGAAAETKATAVLESFRGPMSVLGVRKELSVSNESMPAGTSTGRGKRTHPERVKMRKGLRARFAAALEESEDFELSETLDALRKLENRPESPVSSLERTALLERFVELSPETALSYSDTLFGPAREEAVATIIGSWTARDPEAAAGFMAENLDDFGVLDQTQRSLAGQVAGEWSRQDKEGALSWATNLPVAVRGEAYARIVGEMVGEDPASGVTFVQGLEPGFEKAEATEALVTQWVGQDAQAAADWVEKQSHMNEGESAAGSLVNAWMESDPMKASQWIAGLEPGAVKDRAIMAMTQSRTLIRDPEAAWLWVSQIEDEAMKAPLLEALGGKGF